MANIDPKTHTLEENASIEKDLLQGITSWASPILPKEWQLSGEESIGYGGCTPPDKPHKYTLTIYALNKKINLKNGFYLNELIWGMDNHILESASLNMIYDNTK